jgi:hypothetical protein
MISFDENNKNNLTPYLDQVIENINTYKPKMIIVSSQNSPYGYSDNHFIHLLKGVINTTYEEVLKMSTEKSSFYEVISNKHNLKTCNRMRVYLARPYLLKRSFTNTYQITVPDKNNIPHSEYIIRLINYIENDKILLFLSIKNNKISGTGSNIMKLKNEFKTLIVNMNSNTTNTINTINFNKFVSKDKFINNKIDYPNPNYPIYLCKNGEIEKKDYFINKYKLNIPSKEFERKRQQVRSITNIKDDKILTKYNDPKIPSSLMASLMTQELTVRLFTPNPSGEYSQSVQQSYKENESLEKRGIKGNITQYSKGQQIYGTRLFKSASKVLSGSRSIF